MTPLLAGSCALIVAASLLGGAFPLASVLTHTRLQLYLSLSAGVMLGAAFCHMLPEAVEAGSASTLQWSAAGLLALFLLERFFTYHHHEPPGDPIPVPDPDQDHGRAGVGHLHLQWRAAGFGLAVHSLVGGWPWPAPSPPISSDGARPAPASWGVFPATIRKPADS
ncbi:MAG: ZIP family metal transporter [Isosphaeraceae bacterium]